MSGLINHWKFLLLQGLSMGGQELFYSAFSSLSTVGSTTTPGGLCGTKLQGWQKPKTRV